MDIQRGRHGVFRVWVNGHSEWYAYEFSMVQDPDSFWRADEQRFKSFLASATGGFLLVLRARAYTINPILSANGV